MKLILILLYLTIYIDGTLWAQEERHVFHYPLNIGDVWQYRLSPGFLVTREVIGDTILSNGKTYRIIEQFTPQGPPIFFQRVSDSNEVFHLGQFASDEFLRFKLDIKVGDSWKFSFGGSAPDSGFFQVTQIGDSSFWSHTLKFANIVVFAPDSSRAFLPEYMLVDSIGIYYEGFEGGRLELQGAIINNQRFGIITSVRSIDNSPIENNDLFFNNYPNPFNSSTTIEYRLSDSARVRISIFNLLGERVKLVTNSFQTPGMHRVNWFGKNESGRLVSSGIYFYVIEISGIVTTRKSMFFLK